MSDRGFARAGAGEGAPTFVTTSTHEVLPPNRSVRGPSVAMDPRVPQKLTRI